MQSQRVGRHSEWLKVECRTKRRLGRTSKAERVSTARVVAAERHSRRLARVEEIAEDLLIVIAAG
jgi:hypothetical protein